MKQVNNSQKQKRSKMPFIIISIIIVIILLLFSFKACSSPTYTITFKNYDDSVIEVIEVKEGELPKIDRIPTRDSDGIFDYIFDSWGNIVRAEKDTTYKAKFSSILIEKDNNDDIKQEEKIDDKDDETGDLEGKYFYISFLDDDGSLIDRVSFKYGTIPYCTKDIPNKTIDGYLYTFAGWNKILSRVTGSTTYKATYNKTYVGGGSSGGGGSSEPSVTKYTVSFVLVSGQGTAPSSQQIPSGSKATKPNINCGGYIIEHWYEDNAYTTEWDFTTGTITEAKTLYGKWENKYAVTLDYQGKATNTFIAVESGSTVPTPQTPTVSGYEFIEWQSYQSSHGEQVLRTYVFGETLTGPLTLYAKWGVKLIYDAQGKGTTNPSSIIVPAGETLSASSVVSPTEIDKYTFDDWYKEPACINRFDTSQAINGPGPITLYAGWDYIVKFDLNGHGDDIVVPVKPGNKISSDNIPDDPTATGYVFKGWYTDNTTFQNSFSFNSNINAPTTIYAKWVQALTVTFDSTGLSSTIDPVSVEAGNKITMPATTVPSGYAFKGWFKENTYTTQWNFDDPVTASMTLYPRLDLIVSFDLNGHGGDSIPFLTVRPGEKITAPSPEPTDDDCTFGGWYKDETLANTVKWNFTTDTVNAPTTLYAKWTVRVNYKYQGKGSDATSVTIIDKTISKRDDPTYTGYLFKGWFKDEACTAANKWDFDNDVVTGDTDLYAKWVKIPSKYDAITLEGKNYRILKDNGGNQFLVLALFDSDNKVKYETDWESDDHYVIFSGTQGGIKYEGSELDTFLNTTWYDDLSDEMQAAIQSTDIEQNIYRAYSGSPSNDNYVIKGKQKSSGDPYYLTGGYDSVSIENRKVYALDVSDIINYLGKDNFTQKNIQTMYNTTAGNHYLWLRSASIYGRNNSCYVDTGNGGIWHVYGVNGDGFANPAFVIDLDLIDYSLTAVDKFNITVEPNNSNYGTVNTEGGTYPNGFELRIEAKEKPGYMFVSWDDGNTNKSRFVTVSENKTYTAQFEEKIPAKGDIVTLGGKDYRVLSYDSSNGYAKLLSLYDLKPDQKYYEGDVATATIGDYTVAKYDGSDLDTYLNTTWYGNLDSTIKNAIVPDSTLKQNVYSSTSSLPNEYTAMYDTDDHSGFGSYTFYIIDNNVSGISISPKYVYAPDISDIADYLGKNSLKMDNVAKMFYDLNSLTNSIWLRSAYSSFSEPPSEYDKDNAFSINSYPRNLSVDYTSEPFAVHAMFTINLKANDLVYDLAKVPKVTVTATSEDESKGTVEGSGTYNKGTNVVVYAKPKPGYKFSGWNDDSWDNIYNPRTFSSLEEDVTLEASFVKLPSVGDIIKFNDGINYRVLSFDGKEALVFRQESLGDSKYSSNTATFEGHEGVGYKNSFIETKINAWFDSIYRDDSTTDISFATNYINVTLNMYKLNDGVPSDSEYLARGESYYFTDKHPMDDNYVYNQAYPLDLSHITDYLGEDNITKNNIKKILFNSDSFSDSFWLSTAEVSDNTKALYYNGTTGVIAADNAINSHEVYPAFVIDLTKVELDYEIVEEVTKYTITVESDDDDMGTVRMTGGPKFIDGTEVLLTAKPKFGYKFSKWEIDGIDDVSTDKNNATRYITVSANKTYTAVFEEAETASHGDVIMFGTDEDHKYRVLKLDGNKALVVTYFDGEKTPYWESTAQTTDAFADPSLTGVKYDGSTLDTYLNTTWFGNQTSDLQDAIVEKTDLLQRIFKKDITDPTTQNPPQILVAKGEYNTDFSNYYISSSDSYDSVNVGDRNVFALDLQDIVEYFNGDIVTSDKLKAVFGYQTGHKFWLRSAVTPEESSAWIVDGSAGAYEPCVATNDSEVYARPAFYVDLSKIEYKVDNNIEGYPIYVSSGDENKGTVSSSSTECNEGATVTISATPKDGYKFVEWSDGNRNNPRTIVVTGELTCNAVFAEIVMPTKGQVIKVDNKRYRVLSIDDSNKALVLGLYNISPDGGLKYYPDVEAPSINNHTYDGSNLDNYLWNWYGTLDSDSSLKKGIVQTDGLTQSVVGTITGTPPDGDPAVIAKGIDSNSAPYYIKNYDPSISLSSFRYVFVLDVIDIIDYLGDEEDITAEKLKTMYDSTETYRIWLRSGISDDTESPNIAAVVNLEYGSLNKQNVEQSALVYPSFYIDLSLISSEFDIEEQPAP